jgi:hypothetical protein
MFGFGTAVGFTTALSRVDGISQTLLTTLFSFVGGVLLTYAGFRRTLKARSGENPNDEYDLVQVGAALRSFSWAIVFGIATGLLVRETGARALDRLHGKWFPVTQPPSPTRTAESPPTIDPQRGPAVAQADVQLHAGEVEACGRLRAELMQMPVGSVPQSLRNAVDGVCR